MTRPPDFGDLIDDDVPAEERERLRRAHDMLVAAGPPPELPSSLAAPPPPRTRSAWPRRRLGASLVLAAALSAALFGAGYLAGDRSDDFESVRVLPMVGTPGAPRARGAIELGEPDANGNWPVLLRVRGLKRLPAKGYYELYLTFNGRRLFTCGTFAVGADTTTVRFSVTYPLERRRGWGWVVTEQQLGRAQSQRVLLTT